MSREESGLPHPVPAEQASSVAKVLISAIPCVGGPAIELMNLLIGPALARRREEFLASLPGRLRSLEAEMEGLQVESLGDSPEFVSAVMQATAAAMRTHSEEKLEALRSAVLNVAIGRPPDRDLRDMMLHWVDDLTPFHLEVLATIGRGETGQVDLFPCLGQWGLAQLAGAELEARGLVHRLSSSLTFTASVLGMIGRVREDAAEYFFLDSSGQAVPLAELTKLGKHFLAFIAAPDQGAGSSEGGRVTAWSPVRPSLEASAPGRPERQGDPRTGEVRGLGPPRYHRGLCSRPRKPLLPGGILCPGGCKG